MSDRVTCSCIDRVDPRRVCATFDSMWLKNDVVASDPSTLSCSLCESHEKMLHTSSVKKKSGWSFFGGKTNENVSSHREDASDELMMCLTCTLCFCMEHVRSHYGAQEKNGNDHSKSMRVHNVFFGLSACLQMFSKLPSSGKTKTMLAEISTAHADCTGESSLVGMEREGSHLPRHCQDQQEEAYILYCVCCSKKPIQILVSKNLNIQTPYENVRRLGIAFTKLLQIFHAGIRMEPSENETPLTQTPTYSGEIISKMRPCGDAHTKRAKVTDVDGHVSQSSSVGTSSALVGSGKGDVELMAAAHIAGIENLHNTCYFNSVLQCVLKCRFFTHLLLSMREAAQPGPLTACLSALIRHLREETVEDLQKRAVYPYVRAVLQRLSEIAPVFAEDEQQDSQELFLSMVNGVADEFDKGKTGEQKKEPRVPFEGVMRAEVRCMQCGSRFPREEIFMSISVPIEDSIESGLRKIFGATYLTKKDQYACEMCFKGLSKEEQERHNLSVREENQKKEKSKKKSSDEKKSLNCVYSDATMTASISRLGGTLALHLLRFHCDGREFHKVTRNVSFPFSLDLTPFVTRDVLEEYERKRGLHALKIRFPHISRRVINLSFESTGYNLVETERFLECSTALECADIDRRGGNEDGIRPSASRNDINSGTGHYCTSPSFSVSPSKRSAKLQKEPLPSLKRELIGIVTHRGSLHGGHYVAYVRDMRNPTLWFRCDDEDVETVDKEHLLRCQSEVYMLFYE